MERWIEWLPELLSEPENYLNIKDSLLVAHVWPVSELSLDWPVSPIWASPSAHLNTDRERERGERRMQQSASHHIHWHCTEPILRSPARMGEGLVINWIKEKGRKCWHQGSIKNKDSDDIHVSWLWLIARDEGIEKYMNMSKNVINWGFQNYKVSHFIFCRDQSEPSQWLR